MHRAAWLPTAIVTVILLWLLTGCAGSEGAQSSKHQRAKQEENIFTGESTLPTFGCKPLESTSGEIAIQANDDIWTMNADGSNPMLLTHDQAIEDMPAWSPDGEKIAFTKRASWEANDQARIVVMNVNNCTQVVLPMPKGKSAYDPAEPSWSPDGQRIAFWLLSDCESFITNANGSGITRRLPTPDVPVGETGCAARPEWSPDGTQIAFEGLGRDLWNHIYVVEVSPEGVTSQPRQLPVGDLTDETYPYWSPDGTKIVFAGLHVGYHVPGKGYQGIFEIDKNSLKVTRLAIIPNPDRLSWSPDGKHIAFFSDSSTAYWLYVMRSDGSAPTAIKKFTTEFPPSRASWRPLP